jgi:hypothetical protein
MIAVIILLIATYLLNIVDYLETIYAVQLFGIEVELNPIGRFLLENNCAWVPKIIIVPMSLIAIGFIVKIEKRWTWLVYVLFALYLAVTLHNFAMLVQAGVFS